MTVRHAAVWIDHKEAKIFHIAAEGFDVTQVKAPHHHVKRKAEEQAATRATSGTFTTWPRRSKTPTKSSSLVPLGEARFPPPRAQARPRARPKILGVRRSIIQRTVSSPPTSETTFRGKTACAGGS